MSWWNPWQRPGKHVYTQPNNWFNLLSSIVTINYNITRLNNFVQLKKIITIKRFWSFISDVLLEYLLIFFVIFAPLEFEITVAVHSPQWMKTRWISLVGPTWRLSSRIAFRTYFEYIYFLNIAYSTTIRRFSASIWDIDYTWVVLKITTFSSPFDDISRW